MVAVKLVRGAYRSSEPSLQIQPNKLATDAAYDACVSLLVRQIALEQQSDDRLTPHDSGVAAESRVGGTALMLATHNRSSVSSSSLGDMRLAHTQLLVIANRFFIGSAGVERALVQRTDHYNYRAQVWKLAEQMESLGLPHAHPRIHIAQILGMADDMTLTLGLKGFNALKLVPYGRFEQVMPWLLRRLDENSDALGAASEERPLLRAELARRILVAFGRTTHTCH